MRADMLPYAYCAELSKMLDRAPTFPTAQAIAIVERNLGRPLAEVFEVFDPDPIGSASLACVYQARLTTGDKVAVKVRRPDIGPLIAADMRALDWILIFGETLTIIPPGATRSFRKEFEAVLFSELNFRSRGSLHRPLPASGHPAEEGRDRPARLFRLLYRRGDGPASSSPVSGCGS